MAERRMFSKKVINRDEFTALPDKAKILYFQMLLEADDDGFIGNSKLLLCRCGANQKSLDALVREGFILRLTPAIHVISHWQMQNKVAKDRYKPTIYKEERKLLIIDDNGVYHLLPNLPRICNTKC